MGMRTGRRAFINAEFISAPCLITIGDEVVVGGRVHLCAHDGGGGHGVIAPVLIGDGATIGQEATVMGDVIVGAGESRVPRTW
jgi:acetyltransferase-like isoleucine patch superfamily enzyme